jgi:hypothetical protein
MCFEFPTKQALADEDVTHLWFIEDDMILHPTILKRMLDKDLAVVTADYPITPTGRGSVFKVGTEVIFCGTGCMLVKRQVFDVLEAPYFRTDMRWSIKNYGESLKMSRSNMDGVDGYGLHDINFCMSLYAHNIPIHVVSTKLGQRKLVALGEAGTNEGAHNIEEWKKVERNQRLNELKKLPVMPTGELITVKGKEGEILVSKTHAKRLIKAGLAQPVPKRKFVVDWGLNDEVTD